MSDIIERIERSVGVSGLTDMLVGLSPTDMRSLLLEVASRRARERLPAQVLQDYERDAFTRPAGASPGVLLAWQNSVHAVLPAEFETLELSPVSPLGTSSVVAGVAQNWAVATVRMTEVVSDVTNVLALEAALRRRERLRQLPKSSDAVHLAAHHRLLRGQRFTGAHQVQHFSAFGLVSASRDQGDLRFELEALLLHLRTYVAALRTFLVELPPLRVLVTDLAADRGGLLEERLLQPLRATFPGVEVSLDATRESGRGYYRDVCVHVDAATEAGEWVNLVDGGAVDWTARLLSNAKERLVISGIGSERVCTLFPTKRPPR